MAWPVAVEMASGMALGVVDMIVVGHLGAEALAAVGLALRPWLVLFVLGSAIGAGATALIAQGAGAGRTDHVRAVAHQYVLLNLAFGAGLFLFWQAAAGPVMRAMGASRTVEALGASYLRGLACVPLVGHGVQAVAGTLKALGITGPTLLFALVSNGVHLLALYGLVLGRFGMPALGLPGAPLASLAGALAGGAAAILYLRRASERGVREVDWSAVVRLEPALWRRMLGIGLPASGEMAAYFAGQMVVMRVTAALGTASAAALQILGRAQAIGYIWAFGLSVAATAIVGRQLGARDPDEAARTASRASRLGGLAALGFAGLFAIAARPMVAWFTDDPEVRRLGALALASAGLILLPQTVNITLGGALRGAGDTRWLLWTTLLGAAAVGWIAQALGIAAGWGLAGIVAALAADEWLRAGLNRWRFRSRGWTAHTGRWSG